MAIDLNDNPNTEWAAMFINELVLAGLTAVCFAPGSRSTPLVLAAAANPNIQLYRHLDERSAGFFALGLAKASGKPTALIGTSGTAVANFHPAVIEAFESRIPLIVLTADRPPELRGSGANQTIDQVKLFGDHVRHYVELPVPGPEASALLQRYLRATAARVYAAALGPPAGPVHVNFPFRKPLEPTNAEARNNSDDGYAAPRLAVPYTVVSRGALLPTTAQVTELASIVRAEPRGLIICGPNCPGGDFAAEVTALAEAGGYPIVADPLSGLRHGPHVESGMVVGGYDLALQADPECWPKAEVVIRFGDVPTSAALNAYLERCATDHAFLVREDGVWTDDQFLTRQFWQVGEGALCQAVAGELHGRFQPIDRAPWSAHFRELEQLVWVTAATFLDEAGLFDGSAVSTLLEALPSPVHVFAGNSLPIRHMDAYDRPSTRTLRMFGNRGASGIDGNVSTAVGLAAGGCLPLVTLQGDITFYHDMNGLLATRKQGPPVTFVVLNNDGGNIFRRLPVAQIEPPFTDLFLTPHGLTFEHAARQYGLDYAQVGRADPPHMLRDLLAAAQESAAAGHSVLIEIATDGAHDLQMHRALLQKVAGVVRAHAAANSTNVNLLARS